MKPVLIDPSLFEVSRELEANYKVFAGELDNAKAGDYIDCPHETLYNHGWLIYPFVMDYFPYPCDFDRNRAACPGSYEILRRFPQVGCAAFSRLMPGCHIIPHTDNPPPGQLRAHLALTQNEAVRMLIAGEVVEWEPGRVFVFDTAVEHEVFHGGTTPRDIVLADFVMTEDEQASLREWRGEQPDVDDK